jgi:3-mercaptopyruvate sulfurtransferase SseA
LIKEGGELKTQLLTGLVATLLVVSVGCGGGGGGGAISSKVPSPAELAKQGFVLPEIPRISAEDLFKIYDNRDPLTLVDVRPKELFDSGYIPGARNVPNLPEDESTSKLKSVFDSVGKDRLIVLYCD